MKELCFQLINVGQPTDEFLMDLNVHHVLVENKVAVKFTNSNAFKLKKGLLALASPIALIMMMADPAQAQQRTVVNGDFEEFTPLYNGPGSWGICYSALQ